MENDYFCIVDCTIDLFDPAYLTYQEIKMQTYSMNIFYRHFDVEELDLPTSTQELVIIYF